MTFDDLAALFHKEDLVLEICKTGAGWLVLSGKPMERHTRRRYEELPKGLAEAVRAAIERRAPVSEDRADDAGIAPLAAPRSGPLNLSEARRLLAEGKGLSEVASLLGTTRPTLYHRLRKDRSLPDPSIVVPTERSSP